VKVIGLHYTGKTETVYNFEVKDFHTYFVGNKNGGMWVHNDCLGPDVPWAPRVRARMVQDPSYHGFPSGFDEPIISEGTITKDLPDYRQYESPGYVRGKPGKYQVGGVPHPKGGLIEITHRVFIPDRT